MGQPVIHWEIGARDDKALAKFYTDVFGWESSEPMPGYVLMESVSEGLGIGGGIMLMPPGEPTGISLYVAETDIPGTLAKATAAGGRTIVEETPIPGVGSAGAFFDPGGHATGLLKLNTPHSAQPTSGNHEKGCAVVHWEFWTGDSEALAKFYTDVFGWSASSPFPGYRYIDTQAERVGISGGMMTADPGQPHAVSFYISVDDIPAYQAKVLAAGGKTCLPLAPIPGVGHFGLFADPEGNVIGLYKESPKA